MHGSPVIIMLQKRVTNKFKEKLGILSSIRDHRTESRETRQVAYNCRYTSEHLILNSVLSLIKSSLIKKCIGKPTALPQSSDVVSLQPSC